MKQKLLKGNDPIGTIIVVKNKKYEIVKDTGCASCAFAEKSITKYCDRLSCLHDERRDETDVSFRRRKDLEKSSCSFDN